MTAKEFNDSLKSLRLSVYAAAPILGISLRQAQRYSSGEQTPVAAPVANYLTLLVDMVDGWRMSRKKLLDQIKLFEKAKFTMTSNGKDITASWQAEIRRQLNVFEDLLRNGGENGLPNQLD